MSHTCISDPVISQSQSSSQSTSLTMALTPTVNGIIKAYIGSTLCMKLPDLWNVPHRSSISLHTKQDNKRVDMEVTAVGYLDKSVGICLRIFNSENNKSLLGKELSLSVPTLTINCCCRLMDWRVVIRNLKETETTQYVKNPAPNNYKEIRFSIEDTDGATVENIDDDASIELMLLLDNSDGLNPVLKHGKAVEVALFDEEYNRIPKPKSGEFLLKNFKSGSDGYIVKQKIPEGVLSKNYSKSKFTTRIKVMAGNKEVTSDSGSYMVKVRSEPSDTKSKTKRKICQLTKTITREIYKVPDIDNPETLGRFSDFIFKAISYFLLSGGKHVWDFEGEDKPSKSRKLV